MKTSVMLLFCLCLVAGCGKPTPERGVGVDAAVPSISEVDASALKSVAEGNVAFACDLYRKLRDADTNLFFSPYSISTALAMTYGGARGKTAKQMASVLHFELPQNELHAAHASLAAGLKGLQDEAIQIHVANSLWPEKTYPFRRDYLGLVKVCYGSDIMPQDFVRDADGAIETINRWVAGHTMDKIENLLQPEDVDAATRLVLVNAIYFMGAWAVPFSSDATREDAFTMAGGSSVRVPFMSRQGGMSYWADSQLQVLELPYAGQTLSMVILLPRKVDGLSALERSIERSKVLKKWLGALASSEVILTLPKFKMTQRFELSTVLMEMGMSDAFEGGKADFSGMDGVGGLVISRVIHKAFVEVDEDGTEAAAATAVVMAVGADVEGGQPHVPEVFKADHPFVFLIRENKTGSILFMGRVSDPSAMGE